MIVELGPSQAWSAEVGRAGVEVRVIAGEVWLTREGDPEDHVVSAPRGFASDRRGRLAMLALSAARVEVRPLQPARALGSGRAGRAISAPSR